MKIFISKTIWIKNNNRLIYFAGESVNNNAKAVLGLEASSSSHFYCAALKFSNGCTFFCAGQVPTKPVMEPEFLAPLENHTVTQGRDVSFTCVVNHLSSYKVNSPLYYLTSFIHVHSNLFQSCQTFLTFTLHHFCILNT